MKPLSDKMSELIIARGSARPVDRRALARLVYGAYSDVTRAFGVREDAAIAVLENAVDLEQCYIAWKGESVVGFQGLVERHARPFHFPFKLIREHYGFLHSLLYFLLLSARTWRILPAGEMMFENLVVSAGERKQGIGARLVERAEAYAKEKGYASVGIEVVDTNRVALGMFTRMSYEIIKSRRYGLLTKKAGFSGNYYMRKMMSVP